MLLIEEKVNDDYYVVKIRKLGFLNWEWKCYGAYNGQDFSQRSSAFTRWAAISQAKSSYRHFMGKNAMWETVVDERIPKTTGG